jgi:hypothetical protein
MRTAWRGLIFLVPVPIVLNLLLPVIKFGFTELAERAAVAEIVTENETYYARDDKPGHDPTSFRRSTVSLKTAISKFQKELLAKNEYCITMCVTRADGPPTVSVSF